MPFDQFDSEHNSLVYILEFPASAFTEKTGGETRRETSIRHSGGPSPPSIISGPTETGQLTLTKPYDRVADSALEAWAAAYDNGLAVPVTVVQVPVLADGAPLPGGKTDTWHDCELVSFRKPDVRRGSSEAAMIELVLQPSYKT